MPADIYNANWFANNLVRKYPLDSTSSCIDMYGNYLLDNIITDIQVAYPKELGDYCYVSAVNITTKLVSIILSVGDTPIASVCTSRPTDDGRYYALESLYDGARGVIALGVSASQEPGKWLFNNDEDSRILPTCCSPYKPASILSLSRPSDSSPLTGNILLTGGNDIRLSTADVYINGKKTTIVLVGLDTITNRDEVLKSYLSLCDVSTEMGTCSRTTVSAIGAATPDCSGNIEIKSDPNDTIEVIDSIGDGIILIKSNRQLTDVCRNSSPFSINETGEGTNKCPFPTVRSDDLCPNRGAGQGTSYPPDTDSFTDVDLRKDDINVTAGGLVFDECNEGSITPASESEPTRFYVNVNPTSKFQVSVRYTKMTTSNQPDGAIHVLFGNDQVMLDNAAVSYIVDSGSTTGGDRGSDSNALAGIDSLSINYTSTELYLYFSNQSYHLANIDEGMFRYANGIEFLISGNICIEGIRYV